MTGQCDLCRRECEDCELSEVNPQGGWGRPRYMMCQDCLAKAEEGSIAADVLQAIKDREQSIVADVVQAIKDKES